MRIKTKFLGVFLGIGVLLASLSGLVFWAIHTFSATLTTVTQGTVPHVFESLSLVEKAKSLSGAVALVLLNNDDAERRNELLGIQSSVSTIEQSIATAVEQQNLATTEIARSVHEASTGAKVVL